MFLRLAAAAQKPDNKGFVNYILPVNFQPMLFLLQWKFSILPISGRVFSRKAVLADSKSRFDRNFNALFCVKSDPAITFKRSISCCKRLFFISSRDFLSYSYSFHFPSSNHPILNTGIYLTALLQSALLQAPETVILNLPVDILYHIFCFSGKFPLFSITAFLIRNSSSLAPSDTGSFT